MTENHPGATAEKDSASAAGVLHVNSPGNKEEDGMNPMAALHSYPGKQKCTELATSVQAELRGQGASVELLAESPVPVFMITVKQETMTSVGALAGSFLAYFCFARDDRRLSLHFRCVSLDGLGNVLAHGCDKVPTDSTIYTAREPSKANEYGEFPKLMLVYDQAFLRDARLEVGPGVEKAELMRLVETYPVVCPRKDGSILLKRYADPQREDVATDPGVYATFIEGKAIQALKAVAVFSNDGETTRWLVNQTLKNPPLSDPCL